MAPDPAGPAAIPQTPVGATKAYLRKELPRFTQYQEIGAALIKAADLYRARDVDGLIALIRKAAQATPGPTTGPTTAALMRRLHIERSVGPQGALAPTKTKATRFRSAARGARRLASDAGADVPAPAHAGAGLDLPLVEDRGPDVGASAQSTLPGCRARGRVASDPVAVRVAAHVRESLPGGRGAPVTVAKWLGHADVRTTYTFYAHALPDDDDQAAIDRLTKARGDGNGDGVMTGRGRR